MFVLTDKNGRITATSERKEYLSDEAFEFDFPSDFDFGTIGEWIIKNGELVESRSSDSIQCEIDNLKADLASTDWVISKINEASLTGEDTQELLAKYADIIKVRRGQREKINELEVLLNG